MNDQQEITYEPGKVIRADNNIPVASPPILIVTATKSPIHLTIAQGNVIKALITKHCGITQTQYAELINMDMALLSKYLSGELPITVQALQRILSKITYNSTDLQMGFEAEWQTRIVIREYTTGQTVPNVDCTVPVET